MSKRESLADDSKSYGEKLHWEGEKEAGALCNLKFL